MQPQQATLKFTHTKIYTLTRAWVYTLLLSSPIPGNSVRLLKWHSEHKNPASYCCQKGKVGIDVCAPTFCINWGLMAHGAARCVRREGCVTNYHFPAPQAWRDVTVLPCHPHSTLNPGLPQWNTPPGRGKDLGRILTGKGERNPKCCGISDLLSLQPKQNVCLVTLIACYHHTWRNSTWKSYTQEKQV